MCVCVALGIHYAMRMRYIVICGLSGSTILFPHFLINGTIVAKMLLKKQYVLIFSTTFVWNISQSKKNWARYDQKWREVRCRVFVILVSFSETLIFSMDFRKNPETSHVFHENPSSSSRIVPRGWTDGRTDGRDEVNSHFSQFCECAS